jgi:mRNA-degrading endonuclease toxin of MazEF toxin-antitoxin module
VRDYSTTRARRIPTEVELGPDDGTRRRCVVNLDTLTTIPKAELTQLLAVLAPAKLAAVERALKFAMGLV